MGKHGPRQEGTSLTAARCPQFIPISTQWGLRAHPEQLGGSPCGAFGGASGQNHSRIPQGARTTLSRQLEQLWLRSVLSGRVAKGHELHQRGGKVRGTAGPWDPGWELGRRGDSECDTLQWWFSNSPSGKQALGAGAVALRGQRKAQCHLGLGSPWQVTVYLRSFQTPYPTLHLPCHMFRRVTPKPLPYCPPLRVPPVRVTAVHFPIAQPWEEDLGTQMKR